MPTYEGGCYCRAVRYTVTLSDPDKEARSSMCHCSNCKKFTGTPYGLTIKLPFASLSYTSSSTLTEHTAPNGSSSLTRWFCSTCGSGLAEVGEAAKGEYRYLFAGTLDDPEADIARPKGEFFTRERVGWLAPIDGFQKREIKQ
ncbi:hypothetical protein JCM10207_000188 [Rhodosporidiobolus poonsookiae]